MNNIIKENNEKIEKAFEKRIEIKNVNELIKSLRDLQKEINNKELFRVHATKDKSEISLFINESYRPLRIISKNFLLNEENLYNLYIEIKKYSLNNKEFNKIIPIIEKFYFVDNDYKFNLFYRTMTHKEFYLIQLNKFDIIDNMFKNGKGFQYENGFFENDKFEEIEIYFPYNNLIDYLYEYDANLLLNNAIVEHDSYRNIILVNNNEIDMPKEVAKEKIKSLELINEIEFKQLQQIEKQFVELKRKTRKQFKIQRNKLIFD